MTKRRYLILLFIGLPLLLGGMFTWAAYSQLVIVDDPYLLSRRDSETQMAIAFTTALRTNHPAAYDMSDEQLTPRLDEWMNTHQPPRCTRRTFLLAGGTPDDMVFYNCSTADKKSYSLKVFDIQIEDMKVVDWGEVKEEFRN